MSHCNITMRDRYSMLEQSYERIALLEVKNKRLEELLEGAESNLKSIFDRMKTGEGVYLCYPDGSTIHIVAREETESQ